MDGQPLPDELFRLPGGLLRDPAVDAWIRERRADLRPLVETWFDVARRAGDEVRELMHDGCATACVGDAAFVYVGAYAKHVSVGFFYGAFLPDPRHLLAGVGKRGRHVKLHPDRAVDGAALEALIAAAYVDVRARLAR